MGGFDPTQPDFIMAENDEISRLSANHDIIKDSMPGGSLILPPIDFSASPRRILDSATANGLWLRDFASSVADSSNHTFIGCDIASADLPSEHPANFQYQTQDINEPWPPDFASSFDFVHQRLVFGGYPDTKNIVQNLSALVKPGGWIQLIEIEDKADPDDGPAVQNYIQLMRDTFGAIGARFGDINKAKGWLQEAGFVNLQEKLIEIKYGARNPEADLARKGVQMNKQVATPLSKFAKTLPQEKMTLSHETLDSLPEDLSAELTERGGAVYLRAVWGQRPN
ncbi:hypothetical protein P171DRAFT_484000 [Karstenula rhodostoma CBS 690.94]|uniref:Methyltransferase SirN-like protein n=1 Tax=Karstenula rhodostoma CBS 690.94 TaxID=1392251 RepID=A0A9P4PME2_9PLEO|nr:hypothetical protein P171DRAFT_484000 [Karstenula rhodostoma CBS 690.94]